MKIRTTLTFISLAIGGLLFMAACGPSGGIDEEQLALAVAQTQAALTQTALAVPPTLETPLVSTVVPPEPSPTPAEAAATPTITLTPTGTATPTSERPRLSVSVDTNCRSGPGKAYDILGFLLVGESVEVVGRGPDEAYWIVMNPDRDGRCWLWGFYAEVSGPTDSLPVLTPPPTPTPEFQWAGSWTAYTDLFSTSLQTYNMTIRVSGQAFSAAMDLSGWDDVTLTGTFSADFQSVSGTWASPSDGGSFTFYALGLLQFQGRGGGGSGTAWCGAKSGAGMPNPCQKP